MSPSCSVPMPVAVEEMGRIRRGWGGEEDRDDDDDHLHQQSLFFGGFFFLSFLWPELNASFEAAGPGNSDEKRLGKAGLEGAPVSPSWYTGMQLSWGLAAAVSEQGTRFGSAVRKYLGKYREGRVGLRVKRLSVIR